MDTIKFNAQNTKIIAHRGLSGLEKENTCSAFVAAGNRSYFGIETDVYVTKDKQFVVLHDNNLSVVTNNKYNISVEKSEFAEFKDIILPDIDGSYNRRDLKVPLLLDYIKICKRYQKICVLELKSELNVEELKLLFDIIKSENYLENIIFISFSLENCLRVRELLPDASIQWLTTAITNNIIDILLENKLDLDVRFTALSKKWIDKLHSKEITVNCWTVDDKTKAEKLAKMGVDYITTNILEQL